MIFQFIVSFIIAYAAGLSLWLGFGVFATGCLAQLASGFLIGSIAGAQVAGIVGFSLNAAGWLM